MKERPNKMNERHGVLLLLGNHSSHPQMHRRFIRGAFQKQYAAGSLAPVILKSSRVDCHVQPRWGLLLLRKGPEGSLTQSFSNVTASVTLMPRLYPITEFLRWDPHISIFKISVGDSNVQTILRIAGKHPVSFTLCPSPIVVGYVRNLPFRNIYPFPHLHGIPMSDWSLGRVFAVPF